MIENEISREHETVYQIQFIREYENKAAAQWEGIKKVGLVDMIVRAHNLIDYIDLHFSRGGFTGNKQSETTEKTWIVSLLVCR